MILNIRIIKVSLVVVTLFQQLSLGQIVINEFMASNNNTIEDNFNEFDDWIELANNSPDIINIFGWYISDNASNPLKHQFTDSILIYPGSFYLLWADNDEEQGVNHLSFKLSSSGEELLLSNPNQVLIDSIFFEQQESDKSFGRYPDFIGNWDIMESPSPGVANLIHDSSQYSSQAIASIESGFFDDDFYVSLLLDSTQGNIYFTLDGSFPDTSSNKYIEPIFINQTTVLRFITIKAGLLPSKIQTLNYLFNTNLNLPVVALTIDPSDFPVGMQEYNLHITYFNEEKEIGFSTDAGIERHGDASQQNPYRIEFKSEYGQSYVDYPIFLNRSNNRYKRLILRNASNDRFPTSGNNNRAHLRDGIIQTVYSQMHPNGGYSSFKSVNVYINGNYWGIYHLRERQDKYYVEDVFGYDNVDLLERAFGFSSNRNAIEGDWEAYDAFEAHIDTIDMGFEENFQFLNNNIYYDEFIDYWILQVFVGNFDWLANNVKYFRPRSGEDKWRWLVWDTDHGLGMNHNEAGIDWSDPQTDYLAWSTGFDGPRVWNGTNNKLIRAILRNENGKINFINRFADLLNTTFSNENLLGVVDSLVDLISSDMIYHVDRWNASFSNWDEGVNNVKNYVLERPDHVTDHIKNKFNLTNHYKITLEAPEAFNGYVKLNSIKVEDFPWAGTYFSNTPIQISLVPNQNDPLFSWGDLYSFGQNITIDSLISDSTLNIVPADYRVNPVITSIVDVPNDEGFKISLSFLPSIYDANNITGVIDEYKFYRLGYDSSAHLWKWDSIGSTLANGNSFYNLELSTPCNFSVDSSCKSLYKISAELEDIDSVVWSNIFSGYSIDDLSPETPTGLNITKTDNALILNWDTNNEQDIKCYVLDKSLDSLFVINEYSSFFIKDTFFRDFTYLMDDNIYYRLAALDHSDNMSIYSDTILFSNTSLQLSENSHFIQHFSLFQNYPNPFNPKTDISFFLPEDGYVSLTIHDMLGRKIKTLVDGFQFAGYKKVNWNARNNYNELVSTGMYIYKMKAGNFIEVKKMLLLR